MVITHNKTFEWTCYKKLIFFIIALPQASNALICGPYLSQIFEGEDFMKERIFTPSLTIEMNLTPMNRHYFPSTRKE